MSVAPDIDLLLDQLQQGDQAALEQLLLRYRDPLRRMILANLDPRVVRRVDDSDILQQSLASAAARLAGYLQTRAVPFYPWLRQIALQQIIDAHRRHLRAARRSVCRESRTGLELRDDSVDRLARRLPEPASSPSAHLSKLDQQTRVKQGLSHLSGCDRQIVCLRFVEQLKIAELAQRLQISESTAKSRLRRALERLSRVLDLDEDP